MAIKKTPHPTDVACGKRIRIARLLAGLTQTELAEAVKIKFQQIQKYETGANRVSASRLLDIANVINTPVHHLVTGEGIPTDVGVMEIMNDAPAMRHLAVYANLPEDHKQLVKDMARGLAGKREDS